MFSTNDLIRIEDLEQSNECYQITIIRNILISILPQAQLLPAEISAPPSSRSSSLLDHSFFNSLITLLSPFISILQILGE